MVPPSPSCALLDDLPRLSGHNKTLMVTSKWMDDGGAKEGRKEELEPRLALKRARGRAGAGSGFPRGGGEARGDTCFGDKGMKLCKKREEE